jgi:hypothetical protein
MRSAQHKARTRLGHGPLKEALVLRLPLAAGDKQPLNVLFGGVRQADLFPNGAHEAVNL